MAQIYWGRSYCCCELLCGRWETSSGLLQEQPMRTRLLGQLSSPHTTRDSFLTLSRQGMGQALHRLQTSTWPQAAAQTRDICMAFGGKTAWDINTDLVAIGPLTQTCGPPKQYGSRCPTVSSAAIQISMSPLPLAACLSDIHTVSGSSPDH